MSRRPQGQAGPPARGRRGPLAVGLAAGLLAIAAAAGLGLGVGGDDPPGASASTAGPTSSAAPTTAAPSTPAPSTAPDPGTAPSTPTSGPPLSEGPERGDTVVADELPPALDPVPLDGTARGDGDGVSATLEGLEAIDGTGVGPGNVAGPALRVTVRIANGSPDAVDLDAVVVSAGSGADRVPAPPLGDPSTAPFTGTLDPGDSAEGVYVFSVPAEARDLVTVSVGYRADAPFLVFAGAAD